MPKLNRRARTGYKLGARKIDCQKYEPKSGNFSDAVIVRHEFKDGWKIVEDVDAYDIQLMSALTLTCVGSGETLRQRYAKVNEERFEEELQMHAEVTGRKHYDTPYYRRLWDADNGKYRRTTFAGCKTFEEWLQKHINRDLENYRRTYSRDEKGEGCYRFMHVEDKQGGLHACILLALAKLADDPNAQGNWSYPYLRSRDLGQKHPITIDRRRFHVLECRLGTGKTAPKEALEHVIEWYAETTGKWDQEAFEAVRPTPYGAIKGAIPDERFRPQ